MSRSQHVTGADEAAQALRSVPDQLQRSRVLRNALAAGARLVRNAAQAAAPVLAKATKRRTPGLLRKSIKVRTSKRDKADGNVGVFVNVKPAGAGLTIPWEDEVADAYRLMVPGRQYATSGVPRDVSGLGNNGALVAGMTDAELWATDHWMRSYAGSTKTFTFGLAATTFDLGSQSVLMSFEMVAPAAAAALVRNISGIGASQGFAVIATPTGQLNVAVRTSGGGMTSANTPAVFCDDTAHHFAIGIDGPNRTLTVWYDGTPCLSLSAAFTAGTTAPTGDLTMAALDPGGVGTTYDLLSRGIHYMVFDGGLPINVNRMVLQMAQAPTVPLLNRDVKVI